MSLVSIGISEDKYGRPVNTYIDTDDLEQPEYHYYRKSKDLRNFGVARDILLGKITAKDIEESEKYSWLKD